MIKVSTRLCRYEGLFSLLLLLNACSAVLPHEPNTPSALNPQGPAAARIAELWWVMLAFGTGIFVLVILLLFAALFRAWRATRDLTPDRRDGDLGRNWLIFGVVLTVIILVIVFGYSIYTLAAVENPQAQSAVKIEVIGRRWWWDVRYTDEGITTANEIHMPVGVPVQVQLESADVIHSLWVPELHGKMDLIPTRINYITLQADHVGVFRGECAEFCGLQHANMRLMVVASSNDDYQKWVSAEQQDAPDPTDQTAKQGQQVFMSAGCIFCHAVRGLDDKDIVRTDVRLGPDLTHFYSRLTIAGATLTANRGNLAGWVVDAQHVKPGSLMPHIDLNPQDLQNLLAYLETLR